MNGHSGNTTMDASLDAEGAPARADAPVRLPQGGRLLDYAVLLKPRVMSLVLFTAMVGLLLAPGSIPLATATIAVVCIAIGAGASGAINMWYDRDIDGMMERTINRPLPAGRMHPRNALVFGTVLFGRMHGGEGADAVRRRAQGLAHLR